MSPRYRAEIEVRIKPEVADPQGQAVEFSTNRFLKEQNHTAELQGLRIGKLLRTTVHAESEAAAHAALVLAADRIFANPNIEQFEIHLSAMDGA